MFKKLLIIALAVGCSSAIFAQDYNSEWKTAYKLYRGRKYAEAIKAFVALAEKDYCSPGHKSNCYIHAGYSARNLKKYDEAIAFAQKAGQIPNPYVFLGKTREMDFMYTARRYKAITEQVTVDKIMQWPKYYRVDALNYLGLAQSSLKNYEAAGKTFKLISENAIYTKHKSLGFLRTAQNYRNLKDKEKAVTYYKKVIELPDGRDDYKAEAHETLASFLASEKKMDEALAEFDKALVLKLNAYWKSRLLYRKADLLKRMKKNDEAIKCYKQALATKGVAGWVKNGCLAKLKKLEAK